MGQAIRGRRLGLAILLGLGLQYVMLLFSLHSSLLFADLCRENQSCYWLLNGLYMGGGLAFALLIVPWSKWPWRLGSAGVLLVGLGLFSLLYHT